MEQKSNAHTYTITHFFKSSWTEETVTLWAAARLTMLNKMELLYLEKIDRDTDMFGKVNSRKKLLNGI